jgi:hypothetical protein
MAPMSESAAAATKRPPRPRRSFADAGRVPSPLLQPNSPATTTRRSLAGFVQHRIHIFVFIAGLLLWRVSTASGASVADSALYRGLGHSLATGPRLPLWRLTLQAIYPGLPVLLAALEKIFGVQDWPVIVVIHLFSHRVLIMTYKLVRLRFAQWVAITSPRPPALIGWYLELSNEMLADVPFLFGMMLALYGWERLRIELAAESRDRHILKPIVILLVGLAIASLDAADVLDPGDRVDDGLHLGPDGRAAPAVLRDLPGHP